MKFASSRKLTSFLLAFTLLAACDDGIDPNPAGQYELQQSLLRQTAYSLQKSAPAGSPILQNGPLYIKSQSLFPYEKPFGENFIITKWIKACRQSAIGWCIGHTRGQENNPLEAGSNFFRDAKLAKITAGGTNGNTNHYYFNGGGASIGAVGPSPLYWYQTQAQAEQASKLYEIDRSDFVASLASGRRELKRSENFARYAPLVVGAIAGVANSQNQSVGTSAQPSSAPRSTQQPTSQNDVRTTQPEPPFVKDTLRDFTVSSDRIQVCVWDHECEDGDRVSVTLSSQRNSVQVFSNQLLLNARKCRTVDLRSVYHDPNGPDLRPASTRGQPIPLKSGQSVTLTLRAINGSGNIGQCNYANQNTGSMSISGGGGQDQWSLRGGAGSSGKITYRP